MNRRQFLILFLLPLFGDAESILDNLQKSNKENEERWERIEKASKLRQELLADTTLERIPTIWPCDSRRITSWFGYRRDPFNHKRKEWHGAVDIADERMSEIYATGGGVVTWAGYRGNYGNLIIIEHTDRISTRYAHLLGYAVKKGDEVVRGEVIGYMGSTGRSTGPHLHYETRIDNIPVNPIEWMTK
jgi:murein DD-endopeptidase MepM/ murein hydrolase activator NlpD